MGGSGFGLSSPAASAPETEVPPCDVGPEGEVGVQEPIPETEEPAPIDTEGGASPSTDPFGVEAKGDSSRPVRKLPSVRMRR